MNRSSRWIVWLLLFASCGGASPAADKPAEKPVDKRAANPVAVANLSAAGNSMSDVVREYSADRESVSNFYHLPASDLAFDRRERLATAWLDRLQAIDFSALEHSGQVDYLLLANHLRRSLDAVARERKRVAEMDRLLPFRKLIDTLEPDRWRAAPIDYRATATKLEELVQQVKTLREAVEKAHKAKGDTAKKPADAHDSHQAAKKPADPAKPADAAKPSDPAKLADRAKPSDPAKKPADASKPADPKSDAAANDDVPPYLALCAAKATKEFQETLKHWHDYYSGYQPDFDWWIKQPYEKANRELEDYAKLLREEIAGQKGKDEDPLVGDPIGAEAVAAEIRFEFLPYKAEELIAIGERELAWGEEQMRAAARDMQLGDDWKAALAKVKTDYVPPGEQAALVEKIGREATEFVKQRKLVTVPPLAEETWRLTMISPEGIKTIPYAAYGGQQVLVAYAKNDMPQEDKLMVMRGNNSHFTRLVTPHELIPGHHLQGFYAARHNSHRELFWTSYYVEGWSLYWELRLWDLGWAQTPEDRIGMLFWRMTRAARIIVSLKYHLGEMKPEEMVDFLVTRVGHEKLGATSEVRRFIQASPLYQAGYMIGGKQLYALHKELVGPGKMTEQEFHDAVLTQGTMPIEPLRAALEKLPLQRDSAPDWRF